jgi:hypothetical protein
MPLTDNREKRLVHRAAGNERAAIYRVAWLSSAVKYYIVRTLSAGIKKQCF